MLDRGIGDDLLQGRDEVFQDDDDFRAGILELVLQFPWGIERIDVHHHEAGAQNAEDRDRILQDIGHHYRDPGAFLQSLGLQPGADVARQLVYFFEGKGDAHADIGTPAAVFVDTFVEQLRD